MYFILFFTMDSIKSPISLGSPSLPIGSSDANLSTSSTSSLVRSVLMGPGIIVTQVTPLLANFADNSLNMLAKAERYAPDTASLAEGSLTTDELMGRN